MLDVAIASDPIHRVGAKIPDALFSPALDEQARDLRRGGMAWKQIDRTLGLSEGSTRQRLMNTLREEDPSPAARSRDEQKPEISLARAPIELRTRDGWPSAAGRIMLEIEQDTASTPVTAAEAVSWALEHKLVLRDKHRLGQINEFRAEKNLPPFRIVAGAATASTQRRIDTKSTEARMPAPSAAPPGALVSSEMDLVRMVTEDDGTRSGFLTPAAAGWLLNLNTSNRPLNHRTVDRFVEILRSGRWQNTGEPIIVSREGILNDGQHRLSAIVKADIGAICDVRFGIARAAFDVTGTGTKRTAGNVVAMAGYRSATRQASIARLLSVYDLELMAQHKVRVDTDLVLRVVQREPHLAQIAERIARFSFAPARTAAIGMVLTVATRAAPFEKVIEFAEIASGALCQDETLPPRRLHVRLRDDALSHRRVSQLDIAILTVRAWNAWVEGRPLARLVVNEEDRTSAGFPRVLPMVVT